MQVKSGGVFYNHVVIWFEGEVVFARLNHGTQVTRVRVFYNHMVIRIEGQVVSARLSHWMQVESGGVVLLSYGHLV